MGPSSQYQPNPLSQPVTSARILARFLESVGSKYAPRGKVGTPSTTQSSYRCGHPCADQGKRGRRESKRKRGGHEEAWRRGYRVLKAWRSWSCVRVCVRLLTLCVRFNTFSAAAPCQYAGRAHENPTQLRVEYTTFQKLPLTKSDPAWHTLCCYRFAFNLF